MMERHWVTTNPNPRSSAKGWDAGQVGWRLHLVEIPGGTPIEDEGKIRAICGLRARYGWGVDLFIDRRCEKCVAKVQKLGLEIKDED